METDHKDKTRTNGGASCNHLRIGSYRVPIFRRHFHLGFLLDHHPKAHLHRTDASCHTFSSTAEPFVLIFRNHALVSRSPFRLRQNLVAENEGKKKKVKVKV